MIKYTKEVAVEDSGEDMEINNKGKTLIKKILKKRNPPDISVIIPFYNVEEYIEECLNSLFDQKGVVFEVILINDDSTDRSEEIARDFMKKHDNIQLYSIDQNGPGYARNYGVQFAKGNYLAFLDADDKLVKGIYSKMLRAAKNQNAEVCICNVARFNSKRRWSSDLHEKAYKDYEFCTHITSSHSLIYDTTVWNKIIKREFYIRNNISFPEHVVYEDIIPNADIHIKCNKVVMLPETGYLWRVRDEKENASITQEFYSDINIRDRMFAVEGLVQRSLSKDLPPQLKNVIHYKILETDLRIVLNSVNHLSAEKASLLLERVNAFVEAHINPAVINSLSITDMQMYDYVRKGDVAGLRKLIDYRGGGYNTAPVLESEGILYANIPRDLISIEKRTMNDEFDRSPRRVWIDEIHHSDAGYIINAHIYIHRYNMSKPSDQSVRVKLLNEETGQIVEVETQQIQTHFLTERYGEVFDEATNTTTCYNYDYTGFSFVIDHSLMHDWAQKTRTRYFAVAEFEDHLFSGREIIRGVKNSDRKEYEEYRTRINNRTVRIKFGAQKELQIIIEK